MLVLSRKRDEKIMIGGGITVMVIDVRGDTVRLGIDAPKGVVIHREEVYEAIKQEHILAATRQATVGAESDPAERE